MKEEVTRLSLIDGCVEQIELNDETQSQKALEPIFEQIIAQVLTFEGLEYIVQKRLIGFKERKR